jgi:hypothetical protein
MPRACVRKPVERRLDRDCRSGMGEERHPVRHLASDKGSCNDVRVSSPSAAAVKEPDKFPFEAIAKGITYTLPFVYVCGFVILSLFEADYGIADLSLVRVKALSAGLLFAFFIGYPSLVSIRFFHLLGLTRPGSYVVEGAKSKPFLFSVIKISQLYLLSVFAAMGLSIFFTHRPRAWLVDTPTYQEPGHFSLLTYSAGIVSFGVFLLGILPSVNKIPAKHFAAKPIRCTVLFLLISVLWLIWNFEISDSVFFKLVAWVFLVGLASTIAAWQIEQRKGLKATDWELWVFLVFSLLVPWFSTGFYGGIKPAFGGGSPVPATLYLKEDNALLQGKVFDVHILEETEQGYYVVRKTDISKTAVFVPRSSVSTAQFNSQKQ